MNVIQNDFLRLSIPELMGKNYFIPDYQRGYRWEAQQIIPQLAILGSMSIGGAIIGSDNLGEYLQVAADIGAKKF
jgi:hypothetical protein